MTRKKIVCFLISIIIVMGCGITFNVFRAEAAQKIVIRHAYWPPNERYAKWLAQMVKEYQNKNSNVIIKLERTDVGYWEGVMAWHVGGVAPDVIRVGADIMLQWIAKGVLRPLDDLVAASPRAQERVADIYPFLLKPLTYKGKLYALNSYFSLWTPFYNKLLFSQAGVPYPTSNWSWEDFQAAAKKLTRDLDGDGKPEQLGFSAADWRVIYPFLYQNGVDEFLNENETKAVFDTPEALEALKFVQKLAFYDKCFYVPPASDRTQLFMMGRLAIYHHWSITENSWIDVGLDFGASPLPYHKERATIFDIPPYGVSPQSKHPDVAFDWILFITSPEVAMKGTETGGPWG